MPGIEKMTEAILADARGEAETIIKKAELEAERDKQRAVEDIDREIGKKSEGLEKEISDYRARAESARDLKRRRMILGKKQDIIANLIEDTRLKLHDSDDGSYFSHLYKMFEEYCQPGEGTLIMNSRDLSRLPGDFQGRIESIAKSKGGSVSVGSKPADIEDGFVLSYGGTEENCTFRALIESKRDALQDEINNMLWGEKDV